MTYTVREVIYDMYCYRGDIRHVLFREVVYDMYC